MTYRPHRLASFAVCYLSIAVGASRAGAPVALREAFRPGYQYHVSTRVEISGALTLPAEPGQAARPLPMNGHSAIEYDERVVSVVSGAVEKTVRIYRRVDLQRLVGGRPQQSGLRPGVRRLVLLRLGQVEVPFSPDGPLTWGEIDLVRTDVFTPALAGLLPGGPVQPGERWTADNSAVQELTDFERIEEGKLECRLQEVTMLNQRRLARIAFAGVLSGVNEDGPSRQELDGYCFFDLESQHVSYLYLKGTHILLGNDRKESGRVEGRFVLTRQAHAPCTDLGDAALQGIELAPNERNTLLLYEHAELGVRFLHPRRWKVAATRGRQITLDEVNGSGLLVTLEPPARVPTAAQFLAETRAFLEQQKAKIVREESTQRLQASPQELERFAVHADMEAHQVCLDYYILRQAAGGATLAARLLRSDQTALRKEVEAIARSLIIVRAAPALRQQ